MAEERLHDLRENIPLTKLDQWIEVQISLVDEAVGARDLGLLSDREQKLARLREYRRWLLAPVQQPAAEAA
jgi:hypothetical protein